MEKIAELQNVSLRKHGGKILDDISFDLNAGGIWGIVGPNGAGKTTIMKVMLGLLKYDKGTVKIDNQLVTSKKHSVVRDQVGALIENPSLYPYLTGLQHLSLYSSDKKKISTIVQQLKMTNYIKLKTKLYSLGMKQKLGIAIALVNCPKLVILDEPMNGLDPKSARELRMLIQQKNREGTTFLISSHVLSELQKIITGIIIVNDGKISIETTPSELKKKVNKQVIINTNDNDKALKTLNVLFPDDGLKSLIIDSDKSEKLNEYLQAIINNDIQILSVNDSQDDLENTMLELMQHKSDKEGSNL